MEKPGHKMIMSQDPALEMRTEMQQIPLPTLSVSRCDTSPGEQAHLIHREQWYLIEMQKAAEQKDHVSYGVLSVVLELDRLLHFGGSYFFDPAAYERYCQGALDATHLNSPSYAPVLPEAKSCSEEMFERFRGTDGQERREALQRIREEIAGRYQMDPHQVVLCRNATEAARIGALFSGVLTTGNVQREELFTDGVHISVLLHSLLNEDPGNAKRTDRFASWPTYYARRGQRYDPFETKLGKGEFGMFSVQGKSLPEILTELDRLLDNHFKAGKIGLIVLPFVMRETGAILPVRQICDHIRKKYWEMPLERGTQQPFIMIDCAQAHGTVPGFTPRFKENRLDSDPRGIDCDAFVFSLQKTDHSGGPGLLLLRKEQERMVGRSIPGYAPMHDILHSRAEIIQGLRENDNLPPSTAVILDGMFDPALKITPNVPDWLEPADSAGFLASQQWIDRQKQQYGPDWTIAHRTGLNAVLLEILEEESRKQDVSYEIPQTPFSTSPFIQAVRFPGIDGRSVVQTIGSDTFMSWISEQEVVRLGVGLTTTAEDIRRGVKRLLAQCRDQRNIKLR